jgi:hypothetical protein
LRASSAAPAKATLLGRVARPWRLSMISLSEASLLGHNGPDLSNDSMVNRSQMSNGGVCVVMHAFLNAFQQNTPLGRLIQDYSGFFIDFRNKITE